MKKRQIPALFVFVFCIFLCSCQGYRELDSEYLVSAVGFGSDGEKYRAYTEVLSISGDKKDTASKVFSSSGKTPYEAVNNITALLPKKAVFDHCATALIETDIQGNKFKSIIKYLYDTKNLNLGICLYNTDDVKRILSLESHNVSIGYDIMAIKNNMEKTSGISFKNKYYEICSLQMAKDGFCIPKVTEKGKRPAISAQTAYFKFLPVYEFGKQESQTFNLLKNGSGGGEISVGGKRCRVNRISTDIKYQKGRLAVKINCKYRNKKDENNNLIKKDVTELLGKLINIPAINLLCSEKTGEITKAEVTVDG